MLGSANTTSANVNYSSANPFTFADPFVEHAFEWRDGKLTDLGALPGIDSSAVYQVNGRGIGAGESETGVFDPQAGYVPIHAVAFADGTVTDLGTLPGGTESLAASINDRGQIAGFGNNGVPDPNSFFPWGTETRSFIWRDGAMRDIGTLGGPDALMNNMNARGQIAGDSFTNDTPNPTGIGGFCPATGTPTTDPFLWTDGHMRDLGTLGGTASVTTWLNESGEVVGQDYLAGNQACRPFLWNGRRLIDLGTFGGDQGAANHINDAGVVVGWSLLTGESTAHAFEWRNGVMTDLSGTSSPDCTIAESVNNSGVAVGDTCAEDDALISVHGEQYDLNAFVPPSDVHLTDAPSINDRDQIVALGEHERRPAHVPADAKPAPASSLNRSPPTGHYHPPSAHFNPPPGGANQADVGHAMGATGSCAATQNPDSLRDTLSCTQPAISRRKPQRPASAQARATEPTAASWFVLIGPTALLCIREQRPGQWLIWCPLCIRCSAFLDRTRQADSGSSAPPAARARRAAGAGLAEWTNSECHGASDRNALATSRTSSSPRQACDA